MPGPIFCKNCGNEAIHHDELETCVDGVTTFEPCELCGKSAAPHIASSGCRSGKRPHCTCDTCF
jgi:hypothetical protein